MAIRVELKTQITKDTAPTVVVPLRKDMSLPSEWQDRIREAGLSEAQIADDFKGNHKEVHTFYLPWNGSPKKICLVGLGANPGFEKTLSALRSFTHQQRKKLPAQVSLYLSHWTEEEGFERLLEAALNGILLGRYRLDELKTQTPSDELFRNTGALLEVVLPEALHVRAGALSIRVRKIADSQLQVFNLVNKPSNYITPQALARWAVSAGKQSGFDVQVMEKDELREKGFHALLAVNQGSADPPACIVMDYQPKDQEPLGTICLVGKGVTFDTGGLSIKPSMNMHFMKSDMGGAAAVMGALEAAAKLELPLRIIGLVPSTDNCVGPTSLKPNEVISSYSGKTIEVIDTDAEGRLILADGLSYAVRNYTPDVLIDLATLTGSTIRTLGYVAGGLFCNNDQLAEGLIRSGERSGERLWRLPIWDDYKDAVSSDIADVKNFSGKPTAGAIHAAKFLETFIDEHPSWAHLDIAGVALTDSEFAQQKSATAYGVRLLIDFFEDWIANRK